MGNTFYFEWEVQLMLWLQKILGSGKIVHLFSKLFALAGNEIVLVGILTVLYLGVNKHLGKTIGVSVVTALGLGAMLKNIALRRRPYFDHPEIQCLEPLDPKADLYSVRAQGFSFPSMHAMNSTVMYGSLATAVRKRWLTGCAVILSFGIGFSRIIVGVHYPTDVIAGWLLGVMVMFVIAWLQKKVRKQWVLYFAIIMLNLPGLFFCRTNDYFTSMGVMIGFFAALIFEERFVRFENAQKKSHVLCRLFFAGLIFLCLTELVKLPFSTAFLESETWGEHLFRTLRYMVALFVTMGLYPMLFKRIKILQ